MLILYRLLTICVHPLLWCVLLWRGLRGKQEWHRLRESAGAGYAPRPHNIKVIWIHAASVGEFVSVLPMTQKLIRETNANILLTTTTRTAAALAAEQCENNPRLTHHYAPFDSPLWVARFLNHWRPAIALRVESEIWANTIAACAARNIPQVLVNGRLSQTSYSRWQKLGGVFAQILAPMQLVLTQDPQASERFRKLGVENAQLGNLKLEAPPLPADPQAVAALKQQIGEREFWLAASTHKGEEAIIAAAHKLCAATHPNLLTIIAPRHPERGASLAAELRAEGFNVAQRSRAEPPTAATQIYLADTLGEMGVLFSAASIVAMGGTLAPHGGHNALEAIRLDCAVIYGEHTDNFAQVFAELAASDAAIKSSNAADIAKQLSNLLSDTEYRNALIARAKTCEQSMKHSRQVIDAILPIINSALNGGAK